MEQVISGKEIFETFKPDGAVAVIIARREEKDVDPGTDYQGIMIQTEFILAWSATTRKSFGQLRKAAAAFEPTRFLAEGDYKIYEHRERYLHGGGDYLAAERNTGWQVFKMVIDGNLGCLYRIAAVSQSILAQKIPG